MMTDASSGLQEESGWEKLGAELKERTLKPLSHVTFGLYFLIGVLIFGGLGVWFECGKWWNNPASGPDALLTSVVTFFPALVGASSVHIIFEENDNRRMRAFAVGYLILFAAVATALMFLQRIPVGLQFFVAITASVGSLWVWWIANANNPAFKDEIDMDDPLGGSVQQKPAGSLAGFQS